MGYPRKKADARVREDRARIMLRPDGGLRLAVVADTHSLPHANTTRLMRESAPDVVLHAGDIGDLAVLDAFRDLAPLHVVRGNIDVRAADLPDVLDIDVVTNSDESALKILLLHIGVAGPRLRGEVSSLAQQKAAQVVVCGHSHVPFIGHHRGVMIFNPGSAGPRRFHLPIVFGMMEIKAGKLSAWHVDCETGARWAPPGL